MPISKFVGPAVAVALLIFTTPVFATDDIAPQHRAAAQDTASAVGATRQIELVMPLMMGQMERNFAQFNPELTDQFAAAFETLGPQFKARMDAFANRIADAYAKKFTIDELKTITAFYSSTAGKKYVRANRALEKSNARIGREFSEQLGKEIDIAVRAEMKKRGHDF